MLVLLIRDNKKGHNDSILVMEDKASQSRSLYPIPCSVLSIYKVEIN